MKIGIRDFQSLKSVNLEFEGFAVVTGESNLGKSALVRAVRALIFGMLGEHFIRKGSQMTAVGVKFDDSLTMKWQKVPASNKAPGLETTLKVNDQTYTKLGRDQSSIAEPLGFVNIQTEAGYIRPQIAGQFDKAFLLDVGETTVAEVFKVLGRGDVVATAREHARRDLGKSKSELKIRSSDRELAATAVAKMQWLPELLAKVGVFQASVKEVKPREDLLGEVGQHLMADIPESLPKVPQLLDDVMARKLGWIEEYAGTQDIQVPGIPSPSVREVALLEAVTEYLETATELEKSIRDTDTELKEVTKAVKNLEEELGVCPVCGKDF